MGSEVWFFDCDGVILDSNRVKTEGFRKAAEPYGAAEAESLVRYHVRHGGMSRYEKFDHFFHDILQSPKRPEDLQGVLTSYAAFIREGLNRCAEVRGARTFLECLRQADARCFVVSGSDQEELREVLAARNLAGYFQGIFGSPEKKMDIVRRVWAEERQRGAVSASLCGDSRLDFEVARSCGLRFIMIHGYTEWDGWREMLPPDVTSCTDFVELPKANLCG